MGEKFFHTHVHSKFSAQDALTDIAKMVARAKAYKQPAVALTDHGNMAGTIQLYEAGQKQGLQVFPGLEGYLVDSTQDTKAQRYHIGLLSLTLRGYQALSELSSLSHRRENFHRFPRFDLSHLAQLSEDPRSEDIAVLTGCYFGFVQQSLIHQGYNQAKSVVEMYARWFPNTFVEIQNHNIDHTKTKEPSGWTDEDICDAMVTIADEVGLPVIATQDSHYLDSKDKDAHAMMKRMVYGGAEDEFPGDSFHFASSEWVQEHHDPGHWKKAQEAYQLLLDLHDLEFPPLDQYKTHIPKTVKAPIRTLRKAVYAGLKEFHRAGKLKYVLSRYEKRLEHELDIIEKLKMSGYFVKWIQMIEWLDENNVAREARGSSNGSLVCYLLKITSQDPLQWGLLFERFLSEDRIKPPDIDMDIEDRWRDEFVNYMHKVFGAVQIGTFAELGARENDDKGSVLVTYNAYLRRRYIEEYGKEEGAKKFAYQFGRGVETIAAVRQVDRRDYIGLRRLSRHKVYKSYGVHPAGLLLNGSDLKISDYVPTMLVASSKKTVTQFIGDDVEKLGLLKDDALGQRTLTAMARTQELILEGDYDHEAMGMSQDPHDFSWIPLDDSKTCRFLRQGREKNGIFQFEGWAMAKGARQLGIRNTNDCVLAQALFRPGVNQDMTNLFIERRKHPEARRDIEYPHPAFEEVLKPTFGVPLYQEQGIEILRKLGMDIEGINIFFKVVKDSGKGATERNAERLAEVKKQWAAVCKNNGIEDVAWAWSFLEGFMQYGFNKAHSVGYGVRAYRAAFLKVHFTLEFTAANLETVAGKPSEAQHMKEARHMGISLLQPDINISGPVWTLDRQKNAVRKGLLSIPGIGEMAAREISENAPYDSVEDIIERNSGHAVKGGKQYLKDGSFTSGLLALREAGALSSLGIYRQGH
ncbi:DNA polymerase III subunit alpha [Streptomyces levis]|uniref:DNA-directed DNA polymerase n=1 Tax=Streptomyces levis TaxID=285566 RepID=A0ABN3P2N4_9ACTN